MTETAGTKGYKAARVRDIVERAGLSTPLFYTHFNSKEDCLLAAFDAAVASILELVQAAVARLVTIDRGQRVGGERRGAASVSSVGQY